MSPLDHPPLEAAIPTPIELAHKAAQIAQEKKAEDLVLLELERKVSYCDFFLVCSGRNRRQVRAIAESIATQFKRELGIKALSVEGMETGRWVLLDFGDIVVHDLLGRRLGAFPSTSSWIIPATGGVLIATIPNGRRLKIRID